MISVVTSVRRQFRSAARKQRGHMSMSELSFSSFPLDDLVCTVFVPLVRLFPLLFLVSAVGFFRKRASSQDGQRNRSPCVLFTVVLLTFNGHGPVSKPSHLGISTCQYRVSASIQMIL